MNLLTDIIRDVAKEYGMEPDNDVLLQLQKEVMSLIVSQVSIQKDHIVSEMDFPWLEKKRTVGVV